MKTVRIIFFFFLCILSSKAQIIKPATWTMGASPDKGKIGDVIELVFKVSIEDGWYLYSSDFDPNLGPIVTNIKFTPNNTYELVGGLKAINPKRKFDKEIWNGEYSYFVHQGEFRQKIKILREKPTIEGRYESQVCSDKTGQCVPINGNISLSKFFFSKGEENKSEEENSQEENNKTKENKEKDSLQNSEKNLTVQNQSLTHAEARNKALAQNPERELWEFLLLAMLGGLISILTPCVFPMLPMTVSFFTGKRHTRSQAISMALLYGLSIVAIYTLIGTIVSRINGPGFANYISSHWLPNIIFFIVFIVFGLSFLGLFEIVLPHSLVNKMDSQADKGGYGSLFFMAFTLVLVSFSCTGPIVGSILIASAGGEVVKPILGMMAFSSAFALPFVIFALFPQALKSLPKSGGWLNSIKVVLGFLELALALKFLSTADQVYHWRILDREVFLAFWIVIFGLIGIYLLGKLRLPHDSITEKVSIQKLVLSIISFAFVVYMIPGLWGAPLKSLSGLLPPIDTQDFVVGSSEKKHELSDTIKHSQFLHLPHNLEGFFEYKQALAQAKKVNKPVFIDFTGHSCANCRKMEEYVWSAPEVLKRLKNDYVVVALYVDEKTELPQKEWFTSKYDNEVKKTAGEQNTDLQITKYNNNAQPYYCLVDSDGNLLVKPQGLDYNVSTFVEFLEQGKKAFTEKQTSK